MKNIFVLEQFLFNLQMDHGEKYEDTWEDLTLEWEPYFIMGVLTFSSVSAEYLMILENILHLE